MVTGALGPNRPARNVRAREGDWRHGARFVFDRLRGMCAYACICGFRVGMQDWCCGRGGVMVKNVVMEAGVAAVGGGLARGHLVAE